MSDGKFSSLIEDAERNIIAYKVNEWKQQEIRKLMNNKRITRTKAEKEADKYTVPEFLKDGTIKIEWENGFILLDLAEFRKLPKTKMTKILKCGGN